MSLERLICNYCTLTPQYVGCHDTINSGRPLLETRRYSCVRRGIDCGCGCGFEPESTSASAWESEFVLRFEFGLRPRVGRRQRRQSVTAWGPISVGVSNYRIGTAVGPRATKPSPYLKVEFKPDNCEAEWEYGSESESAYPAPSMESETRMREIIHTQKQYGTVVRVGTVEVEVANITARTVGGWRKPTADLKIRQLHGIDADIARLYDREPPLLLYLLALHFVLEPEFKVQGENTYLSFLESRADAGDGQAHGGTSPRESDIIV
ncbi:hypothetical protein BJ138DRAFT_1106262 [Hygrophoropsis aurantiaca]|uniref:Uncharacterized protein n=1 Tax=Hygrophoropsis aurantiaca TaxID=72124 RepID=A0ACB7ZWN7_9AGAM|nr:hypothetical protein BJ138DRAFT_1106262 [Hygrophoropsis aurantiaca]